MMSAYTRALFAGLILFVSSESLAAITGPTQSSGQFTLSWTYVDPIPNDGSYAYLLDVTTGDEYDTSPVNFSKTDGTYVFEETLCLELWSSITCHVMDTHTVVVSGNPPPPYTGPDHVVKQADFNNDGQTDLAVVAPVASNRHVDDFLLINVGGGNYAPLLNPTSSQITAARNAATVTGDVLVADANLDGKNDVIVRGVAGLDEFVFWSSSTQPANFPIRPLRLDTGVRDFVTQSVARFGDPGYFSNAVTTQTITQAGWYVVTVFITSPGYFYDEFGNWRWFDVGMARILLYFEIGQTIEVLAAWVSGAAYSLGELIGQVEILTDVSGPLEDILIILEDILNTEIGLPDIRPPWGNSDDAPAVIPGINVVFDVLCEAIGAFCEGTGGPGGDPIIEFLTLCLPSSIAEAEDRGSFVMPKVSAPPGQNYLITNSQRSLSNGNTQTTRRDFWVDRLNTSRDPLAPLAIDVVDNAYWLGCAANERYLSRARQYGVTNSLLDVGLRILRAHVDFTDGEDDDGGPYIIGKLGPRQVADYHHQVFQSLNLPKSTFGGTLTGIRWEAKWSSLSWCPSCDDDD